MPVYNSIHTNAEIDSYVLKSQIINLIYPVGSIYISENSTSPATLFGGTWTQIKDTFILAAGDTYTAGDIGGGYIGNTDDTILTVDQIPSHTHNLIRQQWWGKDAIQNNNTGAIYNWRSGNGSGGTTSQTYHDGSSHVIMDTGGGQGHSHTIEKIPPCIVVYMWQRTA